MKMNVVSYPDTSINTKLNQILEENALPSRDQVIKEDQWFWFKSLIHSKIFSSSI